METFFLKKVKNVSLLDIISLLNFFKLKKQVHIDTCFKIIIFHEQFFSQLYEQFHKSKKIRLLK